MEGTNMSNNQVPVDFKDIEDAYDFVSFGLPYTHSAYLSKSTGKIYYHSEFEDGFDEIPEDVFDNDDYVEIPHKNDLDLGKKLVWRFVGKEIPGLHDKVESIFARKGAYSRFKEFLQQMDLLEKWYEFEHNESQKALRQWCEDNNIGLTE